MMTTDRRRLLELLGAGGIATLAGCLGNGADTAADWRTASLEDTTTGETFSIAEFTVPTLVHTFASNCLTCASQHAEFRRLWPERDDLEIVELTIDPNDTAEDVARHAEDAGLAWRVGVATEAVTASLVEEFGQAVTVSAQSPIIVVCPDGPVTTVRKVAPPAVLENAIADPC